MEGNSNKEEEEEEEQEYNYYLEMVDGWVFSDDTFGHAPYDQRDPAHTPCPPNPRNVYQLERAMHGLNSLQLAHDAPISAPALDTVLEVLWQSQPLRVRAACRVLPPNGPELWGVDDQKANLVLSELALGPENDARNVEFFTKLAFYNLDEKRDARCEDGRPLGNGKGVATEYDEAPLYHVVWPILVHDQHGEDWVTLIWTQTMRHDEKSRYAQIQEFYVVDPRLDSFIHQSHHEFRDRRNRILKRFESLLANLDAICVVTFAPGCLVEDENGTRLDSWWYSPQMPFDENSSGERCYAVVKQWMWKLTHAVYPNADDNAATQSPNAVLRAVNPYFERMAMLGICTWVAMGSLSFDARVTIESLPEGHTFPVLVNGRHWTMRLSELQGPAEEPQIGGSIPQLDYWARAIQEKRTQEELEREKEAAARDAAARGNQATPAASAGVSTTGGNAAQVPIDNASQAQATVSVATNNSAQTPGPQQPSQHTESHQRLSATMDWMLTPRRGPFVGSKASCEPRPQLADTSAAPELKAGNDKTLGARGSWFPSDDRLERRGSRRGEKTQSQGVSTPPGGEAVESSSGSYSNSESSDGESLGPPPKLRLPKTMTPRSEPAQDKAVRSNKRPATDARLDLSGIVTPQDKRQRSQITGAEPPLSDGKPLMLDNPFSTPSSGDGLLRTPAKRGIHLLPSSPTHAHRNTATDDDDDTGTAGPHQRHAKPAPASKTPGPDQGGLDYDHMNQVFGTLPGSFSLSRALNNKDQRRRK